MSDQSIGVWKILLSIKSLNLKNFRQFEELDIDFNKRITLLVGENGCGKTSVLEALAKLLTVFTEDIRANNTKNLDVNKLIALNDINNDSDATNIQIELDCIIESDEEKAPAITLENLDEIRRSKIVKVERWGDQKKLGARQLYRYLDLQNEEDKIISEVHKKTKEIEDEFEKHLIILNEEHEEKVEQISKKTNFQFKWYISRNKNPFDDGVSRATNELNDLIRDFRVVNISNELKISLPLLVYYACEKYNLTSIDSPIGLNPLDAYHNSLTGDTFSLQQFIDWYKWQDRLSEKTKDYDLLNEINNRIQKLFNGDENGLFRAVRMNYSNNPNGDFELLKKETWVEAMQLSSGEKMILALVGDLIKRIVIANPDNKSPFDNASGIVLIDEIDLHLHAKWQREILERLYKEMFPNIQFIIATHAPLVIQRFDGSLVRIFEYDRPSGKLKIRTPKFNRGADLDDILIETMGLNSEINQYYLDKACTSIQENDFIGAIQFLKNLDNATQKEIKKKNDIFEKIRNEIKDLLKDSKTEEKVIKVLDIYLKSHYLENDFLTIRSNYDHAHKNYNNGIISFDEFSRFRSKFVSSTFDIVDKWQL